MAEQGHRSELLRIEVIREGWPNGESPARATGLIGVPGYGRWLAVALAFFFERGQMLARSAFTNARSKLRRSTKKLGQSPTPWQPSE